MTVFGLCQKLFFLLVTAFNDVAAFLERPLLSPRTISIIEDWQDIAIIGDILGDLMDILNISSWGDITMLWGFTVGLVTVISALFIKWILDWVL